MKVRRGFGVMMCVFVATVAAGTVAQAATATLSDLLADPNNSFTVGDKVFDQFSYVTSGGPSADEVQISSLIEDDNFGIRITGPFADQAGGSAVDAVIAFRVTSLGDAITGAILRGDPALDGTTNSFVNVVETFSGDPDELLEVFSTQGASDLVDEVEFAQGYSSLNVEKDIFLNGGDGFGSVTMTIIDQLFPQGGDGGPVIIPEPAMVGLLSVGALGLVRRRA